jgi:hypothetical protein
MRLGLRHFAFRCVTFRLEMFGASRASSRHAGCEIGFSPLMSSDTLAIAGVAKNEFAAIPMRSPTGHRAGDVAGICNFPCPTLRVEFCPSS